MIDFQVFYRGVHPQPKRVFLRSESGKRLEFPTRQKARNWCRNHLGLYDGLTIKHPDGTEEIFTE